MHSVVDYVSPSFSTPGPDGEGETFPGVNFGKTVRFGMTNSTTRSTLSDGTVFQLSNNDFFLVNQEAKGLSLTSGGVSLKVSGADNRIYVGGIGNTPAEMARFNVRSNENGMLIRTTSTAGYGLSVNVPGAVIAMQVVDQNDNKKRNFKVSGTGEVFARKYTTTLAAIPDYVFADEYNLMPLTELKKFITTNKHLPNIPSALEYEKNGVDLGELNRLLLEKVEELTLYILQMEDRLKEVESAK